MFLVFEGKVKARKLGREKGTHRVHTKTGKVHTKTKKVHTKTRKVHTKNEKVHTIDRKSTHLTHEKYRHKKKSVPLLSTLFEILFLFQFA